MAELKVLLPGDTKRITVPVDIKDSKGKTFKRQQRVYLETDKPGTYTADLRDSAGNVVETISVVLDAAGMVELRVQAYPARAE